MGIIAASRLRASAFSPFIIEVDTSKTGVSNNNQFQFTGAVGDYDVVAKQGGSVVQTFNNLSGEQTITLPSSGIYTLELTAKLTNGFTNIRFNNEGDKLKLLKVLQWGVFNSTLSGLFWGCSNLTQLADDNNWLNSSENVDSFFRACGLTSLPDTLSLQNVESAPLAFFGNPVTSLPTIMVLDNLVNGLLMFSSCNLTSLPPLMKLNNLEVGTQFLRFNNLTDLPVGIKLPLINDGNRFLEGNTINTSRYSQLLIDMEDLNNNNNVRFHGGWSSKYNTDGETARDLLETNQSWSFSDGGLE
jgi:hypothetical protein